MKISMFMCQYCLLGISKIMSKTCYCMCGVCVHSFIWRASLMIFLGTQNEWNKTKNKQQTKPQLEKKSLSVKETICWVRIGVRKHSLERCRSFFEFSDPHHPPITQIIKALSDFSWIYNILGDSTALKLIYFFPFKNSLWFYSLNKKLQCKYVIV